MELTIFQSVFDNKTHRKMDLSSWENLVRLLKDLSTQPGYKPKKGERQQGSFLISPAVFKEGTTRANANVSHWGGWAALDIDDWTEDGLKELNRKLKGYRHVRYSTSSSTQEKPKFRLVLCLDRNVLSSELRHFWYALNKEFAELGDPQTKDLSRMFYVPAQYPGAFNFITEGFGDILKVDELLGKYPYEDKSKASLFENLPEEIQKRITEYRSACLNNRSIKWTNFRDCPFVNMNLVNDYATSQGSWYHKMYRILVSISSKAIKRGYPITPKEVAELARQIDESTGGWYKNRPLEVEAARAIEFSLRS